MQQSKHIRSAKSANRSQSGFTLIELIVATIILSILVGMAVPVAKNAVKREALVILANALEQLPEDYRQVIMLRHLEGLPFAEVAARMGKTVPSVQNLWVRALHRLKQTVGE